MAFDGTLVRWVESELLLALSPEVTSFMEKVCVCCLWFQLLGKQTQDDYLNSVLGQLIKTLFLLKKKKKVKIKGGSHW